MGSPSEAPGARAPGAPAAAGGDDACPLCGTQLQPEQEWCLNCGAAARTRLAATPGWRAPVVAIVSVLALSLGVLAAALIDLAGGSGPTHTQVTRTVTTPAAAAPPPVTTTAAATTTATPTTTSPASSTLPGATRTGTTSTTLKTTTRGTRTGSIVPGVTQPGTSTPLSGR
ncbi:MAG TPA: hypothetical protein VHY83_08305 [Solirubrobacteraceae bacterium]|jgi:hypothetical protein|nr:hypothetical protein [Solirubrobacteraceae bacterium]